MATYTFIPPSVEESPAAWEPEFLQRYRWPRGISLILKNGTYEEIREVPYSAWHNKISGVDYFIGGHIYPGVPQEVADVLTSSGYGDGLVEE